MLKLVFLPPNSTQIQPTPNLSNHSVQVSALATQPYADRSQAPGGSAQSSPPCRPGSLAHIRTDGGGSPAPGLASQMAGHLHCTSCTKRPLLTGTGKRGWLGQSGSSTAKERVDYKGSHSFEKHVEVSGNPQRPLQKIEFFPLLHMHIIMVSKNLTQVAV